MWKTNKNREQNLYKLTLALEQIIKGVVVPFIICSTDTPLKAGNIVQNDNATVSKETKKNTPYASNRSAQKEQKEKDDPRHTQKKRHASRPLKGPLAYPRRTPYHSTRSYHKTKKKSTKKSKKKYWQKKEKMIK